MTDAIIGRGTTFAKETSPGGGTYAGFAGVEITRVGYGGFTVDVLDATHMGSPTRFREYIQGLLDAGDVTIDFAFIPQATDPLLAELTAGVSASYRVTWPNGITWTFDGFATGFTPDATVDAKMTGSATFKITGNITVA